MNVPSIVLPVFALILMGAAAVRLRLVEIAAVRGMTDFVFFTAMPALLFASIIQAPPLPLLHVAGAFLFGAVALFALGLVLARLLLRSGLADASAFGLNCAYGNVVMLGVPVVQAAYGSVGVAYLLALIAFHSTLLLPLATVCIEAGSPRTHGRGIAPLFAAALPGILRNPVIVAIFLALLWRLGGLAMPAVVLNFLNLIGAAGPPLALFCLGASLPRPQGRSALKEISLAAGLKLLVMPATVGICAHLAGVHGVAFAVSVIAAAMPTGANAFLLARRFETTMEASASAVVISTALSLFTLSLLLAWLPG
jgi:hypothetical protein